MTTQQPGFSMSQYASRTDLFAAMIARITELEAQLAQCFDAADVATASAQGFRDGVASLTAQAADRAIEGCPELNMGNYDEVDVERLNDWAIRAHDEIDRLHALAAGQATAAQAAPATQQAREVSDAMVLAALQVQHPAAYGQYLRHPANGPKTSIRTEAEIDTARRMIAAALAAGQATAAPAQPAAQQGAAYAELPDEVVRLAQVAIRECQYKGNDMPQDWMESAMRACRLIAASHGQAPATQQVGEVRRAELVPGVMHCAKCKFQLNRVTLCVSDGNAYAGNNKTEPCPNGCGPLWPVTWEQEAKNCWKALEEMHERLMAAAAPQPSPTAQADNKKKDPTMSFHNKPDYHIPELIEALKAHRLPHDTPSQLADSFRIGWMACRELAQADSVQEDAERYRWLCRWKGQEHEPPFTVQHEIDGALWGGDLDAAIDAAMNKGATQ